MEHRVLLSLCCCAILGACGASFPAQKGFSDQQQHVPPSAMTIQSPAFGSGAFVPVPYTCDGTNVSPPLAFSGVPKEAKSLALIVSDPDAPSGDFVHWVLYNIDPTVTAMDEGALPPSALQGVNGSGQLGYTGPCPPSGVHRYFFHLYALDTALQFTVPPKKSDLLAAMEGHILAEAELKGRYQRP